MTFLLMKHIISTLQYPMYNLIEYDDNYSNTSGSFWQLKNDKVPANNTNLKIDNSEWFKYKAALDISNGNIC